ncbi:MAG: cytochrome b/b6 domain-containing protein [Paracoccaceae bacterium]
MGAFNTYTTYGSIAKIFHWLTAVLVIFLLGLGLYMHELPRETPEEITRVVNLYSLHKTLGIAVLGIAILRILWAIREPKPHPLHEGRAVEIFAAETVHWILYIAILLTPLMGWFHHAATTGFAKIWWPFGQDIFFIPKNEALSDFFASMHWILAILMGVSILAHIGGALKHFFLDRDKTLHRMLPLVDTTDVAVMDANHPKWPKWLAVAVFGLATLVMGTLALNTPAPTPRTQLQQIDSDWSVDPENSTLGISIIQLGTPVEGHFANWRADIRFDPENLPEASVKVIIAMDSLSLGTVTHQAQSPEYLAIDAFATAEFTSGHFSKNADGSYLANGTLRLRGISMPLKLNFTLNIENNAATLQGHAPIARLDYNIGANDMPDDASLGYIVDVNIALLATRR